MKTYLLLGDNKGFIKVMDLRGMIKKFDIEIANPCSIKSNFNIKKKDEVNVEPILSHHLQKSNKKIDPLTSISASMTIRDFKAHDDSITCLALIEDPFSFISSSKDKKIRIWNFDFEILGEINTAPSLGQMNPKSKDEWKFKVDWEKLKQEEITEVIKIVEKKDYAPNKFDEAKLDEQELEYKPPEKKKENKVVLPSKKRFKPQDEFKKQIIDNTEDKDNNINIDDQYHKEITDSIKAIIYPKISSIGLTEMTNNLLKENYKKEEEISEKKKLIKQEKKPSHLKQVSKSKNIHFGVDSLEAKNEKTLPEVYSNKDTYYNYEYLKKKAKEKKDPEDKKINVKFNIGETERILSYEYYKSSYDNCTLVGKQNVSNNTLKNNFNLMWNYVQDYSKLIGRKTFKK